MAIAKIAKRTSGYRIQQSEAVTAFCDSLQTVWVGGPHNDGVIVLHPTVCNAAQVIM